MPTIKLYAPALLITWNTRGIFIWGLSVCEGLKNQVKISSDFQSRYLAVFSNDTILNSISISRILFTYNCVRDDESNKLYLKKKDLKQ